VKGYDSVRRILVRGPNWIGDAVMSEPALAAVRGIFPGAEIVLLVRPVVAELLQGHPAVDRILVYEDRGRHAGLSGKWGLARALRRERFHLAILFQNAFEAALLAFLAGIPSRYGYATDGRGWLLSDPVARPDPETLGHQVQYYLGMLTPLGGPERPRPPRLSLSAREESEVNRSLAEMGIAESDFVLGLNPGSTYGGAKRWLPERFAETADRLLQDQARMGERAVRAVIVGARGEEGLGQTIADRMRVKPVVLSGRTSIRQLMAVIKRCNLFITNDTGPMHVAAAFGVPVVAIFGPTDFRTTAPFGNEDAIVRHPVECAPCLLRECPIDHRCMTRVSVDQVYDAALHQLRVESDKGGVMSEVGRDARGTRQEVYPRQSSLLPHLPLKGVTVFLDRDGTLNRDTGYVKTPEGLELLPGVAEAVARLNRAGARVVVVTNQSGVARGFLTSETLATIHARLRALLGAGGATLDAVYFCPHHPDEGCACRKPGTALIDRAAAELALDLSQVVVVGDQRRDVDLASKIGARSVLVTTGPTSLESLAGLSGDGLAPDYVAAGLVEAVDWIIQNVGGSSEPSALRHRMNPNGKSISSDASSVLKADR
jgi:heptosyltransferase-2